MKFSELNPEKLSIDEKCELVMNGIIDYGKEKVNEETEVDFLIVLGCTPRPLKARVVKAAELYLGGYAKYILFSGGYGWNRRVEKGSEKDKELIRKARENIGEELLENETDEEIRNLTESEMMAKIMEYLQIPADKIFYEPFSNTTLENIKCIKYIFRGLEERGEVDGINSAMLVTSSFHCRRAMLTFRKYFKGLEILACPSTLDFQEEGFSKKSMLNSPYYRKQIENELNAIVNYTRNGSIEDCDIREFVGEEFAKKIEKKMNQEVEK